MAVLVLSMATLDHSTSFWTLLGLRPKKSLLAVVISESAEDSAGIWIMD